MVKSKTNRITGHITPLQILVAGYFIITIISALLLMLPLSLKSGRVLPFIDALFIAFSGISTTGLVTVDISTTFSLFGQIILLCTFQIGGTGYMVFIIIVIYVMKRKSPFGIFIAAEESMAGYGHHDFFKFSLLVLSSTLIIEMTGALLLFLVWMNDFPATDALFYAVFHSVSAFCTAGFSVFPDSMMRYRNNIPVNWVINIISYLGAIGFVVMYDLVLFIKEKKKGKRKRRLSLHSGLVLAGFTAVILTGTATFFFFGCWQQTDSIGQRLMVSVFQSVSASTTDGYNSVDISAIPVPGLVFIILQMFVGAAPGSTGGGIKVTTFILLLFFIIAQLRGRENTVVVIGRREILNNAREKAIGVIMWFMIVLFIDLLFMAHTEIHHAGFLQIFFEIVSALGNTGLSMGITSSLSFPGKLLLVITMFIGRVGPLTLGFALARRENHRLIRYPGEDMFIG